MRAFLLTMFALGSAAALAAPSVVAPARPSTLPPRAERPLIGPPPAWVLPAPIPPSAPANAGVAVSVLLLDQQAHLTRDGDAHYVDTAIRIGARKDCRPRRLHWRGIRALRRSWSTATG